MSRADQEVFKLELMVERDTRRIAVGKPMFAMASPREGNPVGTSILLLGGQRAQEHIGNFCTQSHEKKIV